MKASIDWNLAVTDIGPRLYRYFCASFQRSIASDLVQEVFIRLVEKYRNGSFDPKKGSLRMFAFGIARFVRLEAFKTLPEENFFGDPVKYERRVASNNNVIESEDIDKELNLLLSPLREDLKNELQLKRWQLAVQRELKHFHQKDRKPRLLQLSKIAASFLIGIVIGGLLFSGKAKNEHQTGRFAMNMQPNATIEYIYAKSP